MNKPKDSNKANDGDDDDDDEQDETQFRKSIASSSDSFDIVTLRRNTVTHEQALHKEPIQKSNKILENQDDIDLEKNRFSDGVLSAVTTVNPSIDAHYACPNCLAHLPPFKDHRRLSSPWALLPMTVTFFFSNRLSLTLWVAISFFFFFPFNQKHVNFILDNAQLPSYRLFNKPALQAQAEIKDSTELNRSKQ